MFDLLASKLGEAQAYADGLAVNLDVLNMDKLLEEQEREERSKDESVRLLRDSGDITDALSSQHLSGASAAMTAASEGRENNRVGGVGPLADVETSQKRIDTEQQQSLQERNFLSSPSCGASDGGFGDRFSSLDDGGGNFEDEFDPILASIRKPPQKQQQQQQQQQQQLAATTQATTAAAGSAADLALSSRDNNRNENDPVRPSAASSFAVGFLSMLPGDMRARAGEVMAHSSARISESANAFRSALDARGKRQSDPVQHGGIGGDVELGEARGGKSGARRAAGGEGGEDDVRLLNMNELLSEEERQQLSSLSGGAGGAGRFCGWGRLRKYIPVFIGIALLGLLYLWRWTKIVVGDSASGVASLGPER